MLVALVAASGCIQTGIPPVGGTPREQLSRVEAMYADARDVYFRHAVAEARGNGRGAQGVPLADMRAAHAALRERTLERLQALDPGAFSGGDARAIVAMRRTLETVEDGTTGGAGSCEYDVGALATGPGGSGALSARIYSCYGAAQGAVSTPAGILDRLGVLARLGTEGDGARRRALFESLAPVWRSINGDNEDGSPWRTLVRLNAERWRRDGSPIERAAASLGLDSGNLEVALLGMLGAWRDLMPAAPVEPWDWYFENEAASRHLSPRIRLGDLASINDRWYSALGAAPRSLGVHYDLEPRDGKTPVAFTQFGGLPRRSRTGSRGAEPWVFATYREGGLGNLLELLHETGHAIHIAAIDTRPAFADWPDSDPLTEGLADVPALEAWEPAWQRRYLGDSATTGQSLRGKYASIMMDVAWALFELRMHRDPTADPNRTWSEITREYLRIVPHPEWSWWAMRGQLVESPGYMMNYALGAMVAADVRSRVRAQRGPLVTGDNRAYAWLAPRLYRWGLERTSRDVLEEFLGQRLSASALVADLRRM